MPRQYRSTDFVAPGPGKLQLVYTPKDGSVPTTMDVYDFKGKGVAMSMYNTDEVCVLPGRLREIPLMEHSPLQGSRTLRSRWLW